MIKTNSNNLKVESAQEKDGSITIKILNTPSTNYSVNTTKSNDATLDFEIDKISQENVANMFDVTVQTVINWRKRGWIKGYKIGHPVFYRKSELIKAASENPLIQKI